MSATKSKHNNNLPSRPDLPRLTDQQKKFCHEYVVNYNASDAALKAGYSEKTKKKNGSMLLNKPQVKEYIDRLIKKREERLEVKAKDVINELAKIAFTNATDLVNEDGTIKPFSELESKFKSAIASYEVTEGKNGITKKIKIVDKLKALDMLGRYLGIYEKDNEQSANKINQINISWN